MNMSSGGEVDTGPAAYFSTQRYSDTLTGTGAAAGSIYTLFDGSIFVGEGNSIVLNCELNLLPVSSASDIKWVDLSIHYTWDAGSPRKQDPDFTGFQTNLWCGTDKISIKDQRYPGAQIIQHAWAIHRLPNPRDNDLRHPFDSVFVTQSVSRYMVITDVARGDNIYVLARFVANNQDTTPIFRLTETVRLMMTWGGFSRTY